MKLSDRERKLIGAAELNAGHNLGQLAKFAGIKEHSARYFLRKLQDSEVLSLKRPIIDMNRLGFVHYTFMFSLTAASQKSKQKILNYLLRSENVTWVFQLGGDFQYGVSITVRRIHGLVEFIRELEDKFGNIIFAKVYSLQVAFVYFGRRYLGGSKAAMNPIAFEIVDEPETIGEQDEAILSSMVDTPFDTLTEQARSCGIPLATFERRKRHLEQRGIIRGYFHWVDASKLGMSSYNILVYMRGLSSGFRDELLKFAHKRKEIVYFTECLGNWDFELGVEVDSQSSLTKLTEALYDTFPEQIQTVKLIPILQYLQFKSYTPSNAIERS